MKISEFAKCIKELELIKWRMIKGTGMTPQDLKKNIANGCHPDYFLVNEFPFCSAFCYIFRKYKIKGTDKCFCPRKKSAKTCFLGKNGKHLPEGFIIEKIESIPIDEIVKYLKKVKPWKNADVKRSIVMLWMIFIRYRLIKHYSTVKSTFEEN